MEVTFYETTAFTEGVRKLRAEDQCLELKENLTAKQTKQLKELSTIIEAKIKEAKDHE